MLSALDSFSLNGYTITSPNNLAVRVKSNPKQADIFPKEVVDKHVALTPLQRPVSNRPQLVIQKTTYLKVISRPMWMTLPISTFLLRKTHR